MSKLSLVDSLLALDDTFASGDLYAALRFFAPLNVITDTMLAAVRQEKRLSASGLSQLKGLLEKKDDYYQLPKGLVKWIKKTEVRHEESALDVSFLLHEVDSLLQQYKEKRSTYTDIYERVVLFLRLYQPSLLAGWMIEHTEPLLQRKAFLFLYPYLTEAYLIVEKEGGSESVALLQKGILSYWLSLSHAYNEQDALSELYLQEAIELLEAIRSIEWDQKEEQLLYRWLSECYLERGKLMGSKNQLLQALTDVQQATQLAPKLNVAQEYSSIYSALGYSYQEERELLALVDWYKKGEGKPDIVKMLSLYIGLARYYAQLGYNREAVKILEYFVQRYEEEKGFEGIAQLLRIPRLVYQAREALAEEGPARGVESLIGSLEKSIAQNQKLEFNGQNDIAYLYLAKLQLLQGNTLAAENNFKKGLRQLLSDSILHDKTYFEFYLFYLDLLAQQNDERVPALYQRVYDLIREQMGTHHPLLLQLLLKAEQGHTASFSLPVKMNQVAIRQLLNPAIRLEAFTPVALNDTPGLLAAIRGRLLPLPDGEALLPVEVRDWQLEGYALPFFSRHQLLRLAIPAAYYTVCRYFLMDTSGNIALLSGANKPILKAAESDLRFEDNQAMAHYIRFFLDAVESAGGRFCLVENYHADFPWASDADAALLETVVGKVEKTIQPLTFLYETTRWEEERLVRVKHFSGTFLYSTSLFTSNLEVDEFGGLEFYREQELLSELPVVPDIRTTLSK